MTAKFTELFSSFVGSAVTLASAANAEAVVFLLEIPTQWSKLKKKCSKVQVVIAGTSAELLAEAAAEDLPTILLEMPEIAVYERLTQAVLESVALEYVQPGATVVAVYSGFDQEHVDSISVFKLSERLGRLTAKDLRRLETKVPLETLKVVVDLAVEVGREGREGKAVGTMFVVGDHRKVLEESQPAGFDLVKGYPRKDRSLFDPAVRENAKEIAQMDGAFVISSDGTLESACRIIDTNPVELTLTSGLGSRHYAGAAISKNTKAIAVVVSESNGTVRIFQDGQIVLRIEPLRQALKWKETLTEETGHSAATT